MDVDQQDHAISGTAQEIILKESRKFIRFHGDNDLLGKARIWLIAFDDVGKRLSKRLIREQWAILEKWNSLQYYTIFTLHAGTELQMSLAAPQGKLRGGSVQYLLSNLHFGFSASMPVEFYGSVALLTNHL